MNEEKKEKVVYDASIYLVGIKKRCRKVERHILRCGDFESIIEKNDMISLAKKHISLQMRNVDERYEIAINFQRTTIGNGFRKTVIFQDENKFVFNFSEIFSQAI